MSRRITILYSELAEYSMACLKALKKAGATIQLVHWPVNPEAPFQFDFSFIDQRLLRSEVDKGALKEAVEAFDPEAILCSGWLDKDYMSVCREWQGEIPTILTMDNHWTGSLKQQLAVIASPFTLRRTFNAAFVPGQIQATYAYKLGFKKDRVRTGFYCADVDRFNRFYDLRREEKSTDKPKRFLYLGRYVQHKGIFDLWDAFQRFRKNHPDWELWCAGTGDQYENRVEAEGIKHLGFVQPAALQPLLEACSVYILPSHFEPWGVSVQEMAVAGFPLLLSNRIGSKEAFLDGNGKVFQAGEVDQLLEALEWIASQSDQAFSQMEQRSHELGSSHTPDMWAKQLLSFFQG